MLYNAKVQGSLNSHTSSVKHLVVKTASGISYEKKIPYVVLSINEIAVLCYTMHLTAFGAWLALGP